MITLQRTLIAGCLAGSMALSVLPARADGVVFPWCCNWFPTSFFGGYHPAPAYYGGPLSGATYEYYYGSYWGRAYWRHRRLRLVK